MYRRGEGLHCGQHCGAGACPCFQGLVFRVSLALLSKTSGRDGPPMRVKPHTAEGRCCAQHCGVFHLALCAALLTPELKGSGIGDQNPRHACSLCPFLQASVS